MLYVNPKGLFMKRLLIIFACLFMGSACTPKEEKPEKSQDEIRKMQSQTFDVRDGHQVIKSVLNTLQDDNYVLKNAAIDLGFLTATKDVDIEDPSSKYWSQFARANDVRWEKNRLIEATVNVTEVGKKVRVRVNFQAKVVDQKGAIMSVNQITDEKFYQEFFDKVDTFLKQQN